VAPVSTTTLGNFDQAVRHAETGSFANWEAYTALDELGALDGHQPGVYRAPCECGEPFTTFLAMEQHRAGHGVTALVSLGQLSSAGRRTFELLVYDWNGDLPALLAVVAEIHAAPAHPGATLPEVRHQAR
jgi:hypothetical protein